MPGTDYREVRMMRGVREYQILKWITGLNHGYPGRDVHQPPSSPNLAAFMLEADALGSPETTQWAAWQLTQPTPAVHQWAVDHISYLLRTYHGQCTIGWRPHTVQKTPANHLDLRTGLAERQIRVRYPYVTAAGEDYLAYQEEEFERERLEQAEVERRRIRDGARFHAQSITYPEWTGQRWTLRTESFHQRGRG